MEDPPRGSVAGKEKAAEVDSEHRAEHEDEDGLDISSAVKKVGTGEAEKAKTVDPKERVTGNERTEGEERTEKEVKSFGFAGKAKSTGKKSLAASVREDTAGVRHEKKSDQVQQHILEGEPSGSARVESQKEPTSLERKTGESLKKNQGENAGMIENPEALSLQAGEIAVPSVEQKTAETVKEKTSGEKSLDRDVSNGKTLETEAFLKSRQVRQGGAVKDGGESKTPRLTVVDERRGSGSGERHFSDSEQLKRSSAGEGRLASTAIQGKTESTLSPGGDRDSSMQVMQVHLKSEAVQADFTQESKQSLPGDLQSRLAQQLKEQLNSEIVKRSSILVRNNGSGEIRLELKPEQLGNVKIRISLENNNIAGRILVENSSVKEAFEQNMQQLYRTFREHGFGDASLNVSVGDHRQRHQQDARAAAVETGYKDNLVVSVENGGSSPSSSRDEARLVDMLA